MIYILNFKNLKNTFQIQNYYFIFKLYFTKCYIIRFLKISFSNKLLSYFLVFKNRRII
jgi:hypothetical protein